MPLTFAAIKEVNYPAEGLLVEETAAQALCALAGIDSASPAANPGTGVSVSVADGGWLAARLDPPSGPWMWAHLKEDGSGELVASVPSLLYALVHLIADGLAEAQREQLKDGLLLSASFDWSRPLFDTTLTQVGRDARDFDPEAHIAMMARCGFTHVEVNALQSHTPQEPGVPGEYYPQFYTYCAGLNHFVDSPLTRGYYETDYLAANLARLRRLAELGRKYGLKPGMVCFEPRTLPENFFQRYPTLRGARVDHPFRSWLPRYCLAQDHPVAREHYRQMVHNLMKEVPELAYMSVWTNDSGAGFEHTASLYVGRNGGPYLIREWRSHEAIAQAAGESAVRWLRLIREAAAEVNPDFEVCLRMEPFKVEHDTILAGMGDGVTIEAPSLLVRGYDLPYAHPKYPEQTSIAGTLFHTDMDTSEAESLTFYRERGVEPKISYSCGSAFNTEPLLGIPFPRMLHRKLTSLKSMGARCISAFGGLLNTERTPYWPNPEIIRSVQLNPHRPLNDVLDDLGRRWAGDRSAQLVDAWDRVEEAVSYLPILPLYSHFGFVWLRTWVRPLTPNLEAVPREDRRYFERFMVTTPNNPSINDLGQDVLFELIDEESGRKMSEAIDANVLPRLDDVMDDVATLAQDEPGTGVFSDLRDRIAALHCWATTQRNTAAWVAGVHGYLRSDDPAEKEQLKAFIQDMIDRDLENTQRLLELWETSDTEFMLVTDAGETSFVYGDNIGEHLRRKLELTERYRHVEPAIDRDILWRIE